MPLCPRALDYLAVLKPLPYRAKCRSRWVGKGADLHTPLPKRKILVASASSGTGASYPPFDFGNSREERETLWAGYIELWDRVRAIEARQAQQESLLREVTKLIEDSKHSKRTPPWEAASFLLFFFSFFNFISVLVKFQTHMFVPAAAKNTMFHALVRDGIPSAVPLCNTLLVVLLCVQAFKAACAVIRW